MQQQQPGGGKGMGLAQKLLEKMGWREGQVRHAAQQGSSHMRLQDARHGMATCLVA
jgi:hypothetical protein